MDLLHKIDKMIVDTTVAGDVAQNKTQGKVDVVGGECPEGMYYCKKRKTCVPKTNETIVASAVVGSGQTRVWGSSFNLIDALENKEKVVDKNDDKSKENLGRPDLKFDSLLGAYVPRTDTDIDDTQMENDDE
jgi:hypothetical protein